VTGGRAPSFHDLSMGEAAAPSLSRGMRRGQNSPVDKSSEKTSPGASERKKSLPAPDMIDHGEPLRYSLALACPARAAFLISANALDFSPMAA
jgi:hypothetical protein